MSFQKVNVPSPYNPIYKGIREYDKDMARALDQVTSNLNNVFDKGIRLEESGDVQVVTYVSNGVANTEDAVAHTLKRVPAGYFVIKQDKPAIFYEGGTAWTATSIYLKANVATVAVTILVF